MLKSVVLYDILPGLCCQTTLYEIWLSSLVTKGFISKKKECVYSFFFSNYNLFKHLLSVKHLFENLNFLLASSLSVLIIL